MEGYPIAAVERAMKVQEVILKAMAGKMKWLEAAEVLGIGPRTMRRWKWKMEHQGMNALLDRRCGVPSPRRVPGTEVEGILQLYRERCAGLTVRHFYDFAVRDHGLLRSYTFVKHLLQGASRTRAAGRGPPQPGASSGSMCASTRTARPGAGRARRRKPGGSGGSDAP